MAVCFTDEPHQAVRASITASVLIVTVVLAETSTRMANVFPSCSTVRERERLHYDSEAGELFPGAPSVTWPTRGTRC